MEMNQLLDDQARDGMTLNAEAQNHLRTASKWSKIIAIFGFIFLGLGLAISLFSMLFSGAMASQSGVDAGVGAYLVIMQVFMLAVLGLGIYITLCLYRFGSKSSLALNSNSPGELADSISNLGKYFKINGIMIIVIIVFYLLMLIVAGGSMLSLMG